jgi:hypothetical protein
MGAKFSITVGGLRWGESFDGSGKNFSPTFHNTTLTA